MNTYSDYDGEAICDHCSHHFHIVVTIYSHHYCEQCFLNLVDNIKEELHQHKVKDKHKMLTLDELQELWENTTPGTYNVTTDGRRSPYRITADNDAIIVGEVYSLNDAMFFAAMKEMFPHLLYTARRLQAQGLGK